MVICDSKLLGGRNPSSVHQRFTACRRIRAAAPRTRCRVRVTSTWWSSVPSAPAPPPLCWPMVGTSMLLWAPVCSRWETQQQPPWLELRIKLPVPSWTHHACLSNRRRRTWRSRESNLTSFELSIMSYALTLLPGAQSPGWTGFPRSGRDGCLFPACREVIFCVSDVQVQSILHNHVCFSLPKSHVFLFGPFFIVTSSIFLLDVRPKQPDIEGLSKRTVFADFCTNGVAPWMERKESTLMWESMHCGVSAARRRS